MESAQGCPDLAWQLSSGLRHDIRFEMDRFSIASLTTFEPPSFQRKKQLPQRLPAHLVARVLHDFNAGILDAILAAQTLGVGRSRLYQLRTDFL